jgi:hypothetical protein
LDPILGCKCPPFLTILTIFLSLEITKFASWRFILTNGFLLVARQAAVELNESITRVTFHKLTKLKKIN